MLARDAAVSTLRPKTQTSFAGILPDQIRSYLQAATFLVQCGQASGDQEGDYFDRAVKVLKKGVEMP